MAFLRVSRPGQPTELVDIGPASGRMHGQRFGTRGSTIHGALVVAVEPTPKQVEAAKAAKAAYEREYYRRNPEGFLRRQREYRARKRGVAFSIHPENRHRDGAA